MAVTRVPIYPVPGILNTIPTLSEYSKKFHKALQAEAYNRLIDFDQLKIANVPWVDVRSYGAKVNGITIDTVAVQAAINSLTSGGTVLFPRGTCLTGGLTLLSNVRLMGMGWGSIIKLKNAGEAHLIYALNKTGISISNLTLDGNKANQAGGFASLYFEGVTDSYIDDVFIQNGSYSNITLKNCARVIITTFLSKNPANVGAYFTGTTDSQIIGMHSVKDTGGISGHHGVLLYSGSTDNQLMGIICRHTALSDGVTFHTGCHRNKLSQGLFIGCVNGVSIGANYFQVDGVYADNARATADYESGIEIVGSSKGTVSNCILRNNYGAGLYVHSASNDNVFEKIIAELNGWSGFLVDASLRNKFAACKAIENEGRGYYFTTGAHYNGLTGSDALNNSNTGAVPGVEIASSNYCKVTGGIFTDDQTPKTQTYGIQETGTSNYSQIHGVNAAGNLTGSILLTGVNSVETDNMV